MARAIFMQPESAARVWDAVQAVQAVSGFPAGRTEARFLDDSMLRCAVERQLEILGEALNRLRRNDPETAARVPELDRIVGMRNVIVPEYGAIDYSIPWTAVTTRIPAVRKAHDKLLREAGPAPATSDETEAER